MKEEKLGVKDLKYKNVFNDFSISIEQEGFIVISGPNNCGKTTLIRIINKEISSDNAISLYGTKLEDIKLTEFSKIIKTIIPKEVTFFHNVIEEELTHQLDDSNLTKDEKQKSIKEKLKDYKLNKVSTKPVENLTEEEIIRYQIIEAIINCPKMIIMDDISPYFSKKELIELITLTKENCKENNITLIMATNNMNIALLSDYMYVMSDSLILLEGKPIEVLEKDNILNKLGIDLPFMMDLSVKLRDYDLIEEIELNMDRMVDILWK